MKKYNIVIDTNIIVSALRSRNGFSYKLFSMIDDQRFKVFVSVPIILEYEDALKREKTGIVLTDSDINNILDYLCFVAEQRKIFYLWRPFLNDPKDDMILELAVESGCNFIITFNKKDFEGIEKFGISAITPKEFLTLIGEIHEQHKS